MNRIGVIALFIGLLFSGISRGDEPLREVSLTKVVQRDNLREWKFIVLHHSATEVGSVESIDAAHKQRKDADGNPWRGIGYHFVVGNGRGMKDGEVAATFRWAEQCEGAHAGDLQYNTQGVGICLIGNFEMEPPTPAQLNSLQGLVVALRKGCQIDAKSVIRHTDIKATACPGKRFPMEKLWAGVVTDDEERLVKTRTRE
ncbi:MAG: peptidoglycan recognition family protein [Planctomycetaceae bacterium]